MHTRHSIGFIGAGNLTRCLVGGLINSGTIPHQIFCFDRNPEKVLSLHQKYGITPCQSSAEVATKVDSLILSVKPKDLRGVIQALSPALQESSPLLISTAIGISSQQIEQWLSVKMPIIHAMPNTPALLSCGATGLYANLRVTEQQRNSAESLFRSVGTIAWLNHESDIDTVALLSGSGPAYFLYLIEALQKSAEASGLPSSTAKMLIYQTALGAARLALESEEDLSSLIGHIATPGGITQRALQTLQNEKVDESIQQAFQSAKEHLNQLKKTIEEQK